MILGVVYVSCSFSTICFVYQLQRFELNGKQMVVNKYAISEMATFVMGKTSLFS